MFSVHLEAFESQVSTTKVTDDTKESQKTMGPIEVFEATSTIVPLPLFYFSAIPFVYFVPSVVENNAIHCSLRLLSSVPANRHNQAGNMIGIPNPPATTPGSTPAWNQFTESQWNSFTEAQWNAFTLDSGPVPTQLSARYDAWNRLVEIQNGTAKLVENAYDARGVFAKTHTSLVR